MTNVIAIQPSAPPHNYEAEQALLAACLVQNAAYEQVAETLRSEHFADPIHGLIFEAIGTLLAGGREASLVTLKNMFESDGRLAQIGGVDYLAEIVGSLVTVINAPDYARRIRDLYLRRSLIALAAELAAGARDCAVDGAAEDLIERMETALYVLGEKGGAGAGPVHISEAVDRAMEQIEAAARRDGTVDGVGTGIAELDLMLGGMRGGEMIVLGGRPGMGKTSLAINILENAASSEKQGLMFSLEMSREQLAARMLGGRIGTSAHRLRRGEWPRDGGIRLLEASRSIKAAPIWVDDTPAIQPAVLRSRARQHKRRHGLDLILVDYLQLMTAPPEAYRHGPVQAVTAISKALKELARELDVPLIALSQLSREVEKRDDKRPQLSDLRESGAIEQDADAVVFIYREEYYLMQRKPKDTSARHADWQAEMDRTRGAAELIVAKQRNGPTGTVDVAFDAATTTFADKGRPAQEAML